MLWKMPWFEHSCSLHFSFIVHQIQAPWN
jgi:hypothetical protein